MLYHETLYQELLMQLQSCNCADISSPEHVQQCFAIAYGALCKLDDLEKQMEWTGARKVNYHKDVRSGFLTEVFYYELIYFATLFVPEEKSESLQFWKRKSSGLISSNNNMMSFTTIIKVAAGIRMMSTLPLFLAKLYILKSYMIMETTNCMGIF